MIIHSFQQFLPFIFLDMDPALEEHTYSYSNKVLRIYVSTFHVFFLNKYTLPYSICPSSLGPFNIAIIYYINWLRLLGHTVWYILCCFCFTSICLSFKSNCASLCFLSITSISGVLVQKDFQQLSATLIKNIIIYSCENLNSAPKAGSLSPRRTAESRCSSRNWVSSDLQ